MTEEERRQELRGQVLTRHKEILQAMEQERGSRVITLMHRRELWEDQPKPGEQAHLTIEDSEHVLMQIRATPPEQPIDLIIHTPGGLALAAEMIATAVRLHPGKVTAIVPFYAMSGGTLIALAADEILMEPYSALGPVDPQIGGWPAGDLLHLSEKKPPEAIADQTLILADIARLSLVSVQPFILWLLADKLPQQVAAQTAEFLTGGYLSHDTPIMLEAARTLGLPAAASVPAQVYELFETCAFGPSQRPCLAVYDPTAAPSEP